VNSLFEFDRKLRSRGFKVIAGIDEAGRGCLAGPVVAASVVLPDEIQIEGVRDSKKLSPQKREKVFRELRSKAISIGIGIIGPSEIDRSNIYRATVEAMLLSLMRLKVNPDLVVIDAMRLPVQVNQLSLLKADDQSASVAAASIVAKVVRDRIMKALHRRYPLYGFNRHKGYATKDHIRMLRQIGPSPVHRHTFSPIRELPLFGD
jgi:ribonuclease HII